MSINEVVESLKKESNNPASKAALLMWATRKRARHSVTLSSLYHRMRREGFVYSKEQYEPLLKLLASLDLGRLHVDHKGRVMALKDIKNTLQSIGMVACGQDKGLKSLKKKNKFIELHHNNAKPSIITTPVVVEPKLAVVLSIRGHSVTMALPDTLSKEDLGEIVYQLKKAASE